MDYLFIFFKIINTYSSPWQSAIHKVSNKRQQKSCYHIKTLIVHKTVSSFAVTLWQSVHFKYEIETVLAVKWHSESRQDSQFQIEDSINTIIEVLLWPSEKKLVLNRSIRESDSVSPCAKPVQQTVLLQHNALTLESLNCFHA